MQQNRTAPWLSEDMGQKVRLNRAGPVPQKWFKTHVCCLNKRQQTYRKAGKQADRQAVVFLSLLMRH